MIDHEDIQAELSARLDGEPTSIDDDVLQAHLYQCSQCRAYWDEIVQLKSLFSDRDQAVDATDELFDPDAFKVENLSVLSPSSPDLTDQIVAQVEPEWRRRAAARSAAQAISRVLLTVVGLCYIMWAIRLLVDTDGLLRANSASEVFDPNANPELAGMLVQAAAVRFAIAVGVFFTAWRPNLAVGLLPFLGAFTMFSLGFATRDVVLGTASLLQVMELLLLISTVIIMAWTWLASGGMYWWRDGLRTLRSDPLGGQ